MSIETVRNQHGVRMTLGELLAAVALLVTAFSALNGWLVLPEQIKHVRADNERQDARLTILEKQSSDRAETLARIDERTRRIEQIIKEVHTQ